MQFSIAILLLLLSGSLILAAMLLRDRKNSGYLFMSGFVVLMVTGLLLSYDEIGVKSGEIQTAVNDTTTTVTYVYEEPNAVTNTVVSMVLILGGLWGVLTTSRLMKIDSEEDDE